MEIFFVVVPWTYFLAIDIMQIYTLVLMPRWSALNVGKLVLFFYYFCMELGRLQQPG